MRLIPILALMTLTACGSNPNSDMIASSLAAGLISMSSGTSSGSH
jgi:hypothetical protein